jgi:3-methylfumaryl-CoA hydratase
MNDAPAWLNRREETADLCALPLVQRLAALLDRDPAAFRDGDALPQGWHMILFTPVARQSELGPDGHPVAGGMSAPPGLPRRMLGGRRTRFCAPLRIGAPVHRVSEVVGFEEKQGRSGRLGVAALRHSIAEAGQSEPAVIEEQDVIYRAAAGTPAEAAATTAPERPAATHSRAFTPDPALLFRYSAITFNAHRIHYDEHYATSQEGYPGLIVNGGLTALLLLELAKDAAGQAFAELKVRNRRPLICGRPATLCATRSSEGWTLWAEDDQGRMALEASAA